ncbi:ribulose-phosphate 3-epimerase [bacterium]|nr:ribulose-phosphate 3-epimerase [bacterium]
MAQIYPSLISADIMNLRHEIELLDPYVEGYHIDVMDNHFVPNLTWGYQFINAIGQETSRILDIHLMVDDPTKWIEKLIAPPHSTITIHKESAGDIRKNIARIKNKHLNAGIAINPATSIDSIIPLLDSIDSVLVMSVQPGFSGQTFIKEVIPKIDTLIGYRQTHGLKFSIGMDGGINKQNIAALAQKGVNWFGIASAIFDQPNKVKALKELQALIHN